MIHTYTLGYRVLFAVIAALQKEVQYYRVPCLVLGYSSAQAIFMSATVVSRHAVPQISDSTITSDHSGMHRRSACVVVVVLLLLVVL